MKIASLAEGLQIIAKYADERNQYCVQAEHDELWVGDTSWPLTVAERDRLEELGFDDFEDDMGWHVFT